MRIRNHIVRFILGEIDCREGVLKAVQKAGATRLCFCRIKDQKQQCNSEKAQPDVVFSQGRRSVGGKVRWEHASR